MKTLSLTRIAGYSWFKYVLILASFLLGISVLAFTGVAAFGQERQEPEAPGKLDLANLKPTQSRISRIVSRYQRDRRNLERYYEFDVSPSSQKRLLSFDAQWHQAVIAIKRDNLDEQDMVALSGFENSLLESVDKIAFDSQQQSFAVDKYLPFAETLFKLFDDRLAVKKHDPQEVAEKIDQLAKQTNQAIQILKDSSTNNTESKHFEKSENVRTNAAEIVATLRRQMRAWYQFYDRYDPLFSWWVKAPFEEAQNALVEYGDLLASKQTR